MNDHIKKQRIAMQELQDSLDTLRVHMKALQHDLESTQREREAWRARCQWYEKKLQCDCDCPHCQEMGPHTELECGVEDEEEEDEDDS